MECCNSLVVFWQATTPQVMEDPLVPHSSLGRSISMTPWLTWPCSMDSLWQAKAQILSTKMWGFHTFVYILLVFVWFFYSLNFILKLYFHLLLLFTSAWKICVNISDEVLFCCRYHICNEKAGDVVFSFHPFCK